MAIECMVVNKRPFNWQQRNRLSAEQGDATAQCNLGVMYKYGRGVPQDYTEAFKWYRLAADQGLKLAIESYNNLKSKGY